MQWGWSDRELVYNMMNSSGQRAWQPFGVVRDIFTGDVHRLQCAVYMVAPPPQQHTHHLKQNYSHCQSCGAIAVSPSLTRMRRTQIGYGVVVPHSHFPLNKGTHKQLRMFYCVFVILSV